MEKIIISMQKEMRRRGYSLRTIESYCFCIEKFLNKIGKIPRKITKKEIKDFLDHLVDRNKSGSTVNIYLSSIKFLFYEVMHRNINIRLKYARRQRRFPDFLSKEEVKRLFEAIQNKKHRLMLGLMYSAGLRVSELLSLRVKDFELSKNYGWVRKGKGNKDRLFIVADKLKGNIKYYIEENRLDYDSYLFVGYNKTKMHPRSVQEIVKKARKRAKIMKNVHPHTLRHSFATHLVEDGYDVTILQSILGHSRSDTTMTYVHMADPRMISIKSPFDTI